MILTSPVFEDGSSIPMKFTCEGGNINPELAILNVPQETQSLALVFDDPDSQKGEFTHWLVWNIDPLTEDIKQESVPPGSVQGKNDFGNAGYGGPCPARELHHYRFRLFALNAEIDLKTGSSKQELINAMKGKIIAETELTGTYQKQNQ